MRRSATTARRASRPGRGWWCGSPRACRRTARRGSSGSRGRACSWRRRASPPRCRRCGHCTPRGETEPFWGEISVRGPAATELLSRAALDEALAGAIAALRYGWPASGPAAVVDAGDESGWIPTDRPPEPDLIGAVVALRRRGAVWAVARVAGFVDGESMIGLRPSWWSGRPTSAPRAWVVDAVHRIAPLPWAGRDLRDDGLQCVAERLRAAGAELVPWHRWPDEGVRLPHLFAGVEPAEWLPACAVAAARAVADAPAWGRWRLVGDELVGCGRRFAAPAPRAAWASLRREAANRDTMAPAPAPTGPAPPGAYWVVTADGGAQVIDHHGGEREGVVWLGRFHRPPGAAGEARQETP